MAFNAGSIFAELKLKTANFVSGLRSATGQAGEFEKKGRSVDSLLRTGLGFVGVTSGVAALTSEFKKSVQAASQYETAMTGLAQVSNAFGVQSDEAKQAAESLANDGLLSVAEASEGLKSLIATNFTLEESTNLMIGLKDAAALNRQGTLSMGEAVVGATQGLKNQNSIMVDNSGITKNLSTILTEAGKSQSDLNKVTSDASVRQALYNGILKEAEVFSGGAELAANTYQGRLQQLNTAVFNLRREIGAQLLPVLSSFITDGVNAANSAREGASGTQVFGQAVYVAGNLFKGFVLAISAGVKSIAAVGQAFVAAGSIIANFARSIAQNLQSAANVIRTFGQGAKQFLSGDFDAAKQTMEGLGNAIRGSFVSAVGQSSVAINTFQNLVDDAAGTWEAARAAFGEAFTLSGFQSLTEEAPALRDSISSTGGAMEDASEKAKKLEEDTVDTAEIMRVFEETLRNLKKQAEDTFQTFEDRRKTVRQSMKSMREGIKELRKEILNVKDESYEAINGPEGLKAVFQQDVSDLRTGLGKNIAKELLDIEEGMQKSRDKMVEIEKETANDIAEIRQELGQKLVQIEADKNAKLDDLTKQREELVKEKIALIKNSINDFATAAELAEAQQRIAQIQGGEDLDVMKIDQQIEETKRKASEEVQSEKLRANTIIAEKKKEAASQIAVLKTQVAQEQTILNQHKSTFAQFASAITEQRRISSMDSIALLLEQFTQEKGLRQTKLNEDIAAEKESANEQILETKRAFAEEFDVRVKNLDNLKKFWKKKQRAFKDHLDNIRKKQKNAVKAIEEDYLEALKIINTATGNRVSNITGGGEVGVDVRKGKNGGAVINIGDVNVGSEAEADALINRLSKLLDAAVA